MNELSKKIKWKRYTSLREGKPHKTSPTQEYFEERMQDGLELGSICMHQAQGLAQGLILSMW